MTSTAQNLLTKKKTLLEQRNKLASKPRMRPTPHGRLPFSVDVCRALMQVWSEVLGIDRELLRLGITDINCLEERATSKSVFASPAQ